jgi:hypothetical protein
MGHPPPVGRGMRGGAAEPGGKAGTGLTKTLNESYYERLRAAGETR